ncbi:MAG: ATP-dependent DNA helicase RecG [Ruminococcaceae bacterium]|nr:ATP-dependent DNA helicase RecG [Oscillospiraceae bacterium]
MALTLHSPVSALRGIGPAKEKALARLGIATVRDLLFHIPHGFEDRSRIRLLSEATDGIASTLLLTVGTEPKTARIRAHMSLTKFRAFDESGTVEVVFFNQDYLKNTFHVGDLYRFTGKLTPQKRMFSLTSPAFEQVTEGTPLPDLYPVYSLTEGISMTQMRKLLRDTLAEVRHELSDFLPEELRRRLLLPTVGTALEALHDPTDMTRVEAALRRFAFEELFLYSLGMGLSKSASARTPAVPYPLPDPSPFLEKLPFALTDAQKRVCAEITSSLAERVPMNRILVGDVGCGKTVCAAYAAYAVMHGGGQVALMAPTEILARQHYGDLAPLFEALGFSTALLLGSTPKKEKERVYTALAKGEISIVIGTHALLNERISFAALGLVITDEQHRFGVAQRAALREKCAGAHLLVMSATPIPRTLALVLYGDLNISRIDEMPKGRQRVKTFVVDESYRTRLNAFIKKQVEDGGQVYVVCPAIDQKPAEEENADLSLYEKPPIKTVAEVKAAMEKALPSLSIGYLHGKMKAAEKAAVMDAFVRGDISVLVSTTVIEVGVNVPNATLMIVEDADRFGLAALHQLRGRVGRGSKESFCVLISNTDTEAGRRRLATMQTTFDGYAVAEEDLKMRGPGDFLATASGDGVRQSGGLSFRFASLCRDTDLLTAVSEETARILALQGKDAEAYRAENQALFDELDTRFAENRNLLS